MRNLFLILLFSPFAFGVTWRIVGQESSTPIYSGTAVLDLRKTVGELTVEILKKNSIPFVGSKEGIHSIIGTPQGEEALVVVSNEEMRAYGWCFKIEGKISEKLIYQAYLPNQLSELEWYFAFAEFKKGEWTRFCVPAYEMPLLMSDPIKVE